MDDEAIKEKIKYLQSELTGDIFEDGSIMQEIYDLKKKLNPEIENNPESDQDDEGCLYCGS
jgi:hypothetical protein